MWTILAILVAVLIALAKWPIVQMYAIAAVGVAFMAFTACRTVTSETPGRKRRRWQFSLRTLALWIVPYVAAVAWVLGWEGAFDKEFLNAHARVGLIIVLTQAWTGYFIVIRLRAVRDDAAAAATEFKSR